MNDMPQIPGYIIKQKLGRGGMADVYLGLQQNLEREVAIKVMIPSLFRDDQFSTRFIKEAKTAAQLSHNGIVTIHDVGKAGDSYFIVMEYLRESLKERVKRVGKLEPKECLKIIRMIAEALGYAHKKGFIHRDLKPDNIMFRSDGSAVLVDFGIARAMNSTTQLTRTGMSIGTPQYMSPEQCMGEKIDGRTDIYSLGVVLYELLTGDVPYKAENTTGIIIKQIQDPVPKLPPPLNHYQHLLDSIMAKDRKVRIQDADELIKFLDAHITTGEVESLPAPTIPTATVQEESRTPSPTPLPAASAQPKAKRKWLLPVILVVVLAVAVGAAFLFLPPKTGVDRGTITPPVIAKTTAEQKTGDKTPISAAETEPPDQAGTEQETGEDTPPGEDKTAPGTGIEAEGTTGEETQPGGITGQPVTGPETGSVVKEPAAEIGSAEKEPPADTINKVTVEKVGNPQYGIHFQQAKNSHSAGDYDMALQHIAAARKVNDTPELAKFEEKVRQAKEKALREKEKKQPVKIIKKPKKTPTPKTVKPVKTVTVLGISPGTRDAYNTKLHKINIPLLRTRVAVRGQIVVNLNVDEKGMISILSHKENLTVTPPRGKQAIKNHILKHIKRIPLPPPKNKKGETVKLTGWRVTYKVGKFMKKIILIKQ